MNSWLITLLKKLEEGGYINKKTFGLFDVIAKMLPRFLNQKEIEDLFEKVVNFDLTNDFEIEKLKKSMISASSNRLDWDKIILLCFYSGYFEMILKQDFDYGIVHNNRLLVLFYLLYEKVK